MNVTLNIATLAHRPGDTIDVPDDLAADLLRGDLATLPAEPAELAPVAVVVAATDTPAEVPADQAPARRRGGRTDVVDPADDPTPDV